MLMLPFPITMIGSGAAPAFSNNTTWNPSDKGANSSLSGSNYVFDYTTVDFVGSGVRATVSKSSGKWYLEYKNTQAFTGGSWMVGIGNSSVDVSSNPGSSDSNAVILRSGDLTGATIVNGNTSNVANNFSSLSSGDIVMMAVDVSNQLLYFGKNGSWLDFTGNGDNPSTSTAGIQYNVTGNIYPVTWGIIPGSGNLHTTLYCGTNPLTYSVPTGYSAWDT